MKKKNRSLQMLEYKSKLESSYDIFGMSQLAIKGISSKFIGNILQGAI